MHIQEGSTQRILTFSLSYDPFIGGAEVALKEIMKRNRDIHFDLITARFDRKLPRVHEEDNVTIYRVGFGTVIGKYLFPLFALRRALHLYRKHSYTVVWAMLANYAALAAVFLKYLHPNVKYLLTLQGGYGRDKIERMTWWMPQLYRKIYEKADCVQVISRYLEAQARDFGYGGSIEVIPNGVDVELFTREHPVSELQKLKDKLGILNEKIVITTSRLVEKNGLSDLIGAIQLLKGQRHLKVKLLIAGSGPDEQALKSLVEGLDIEDQVLFLGFIPHEALAKYYKIADVFCRPSLHEGLGNSFLEAMAAGVPVIATPVEGIMDFLVDGETGVFCRKQDPQNIAEKIQLLLEDDALRQKVIEGGRKIVAERFNWESVGERMRGVFERLFGTEHTV